MKRFKVYASTSRKDILEAAKSCLRRISKLVNLPNLRVVEIVDIEEDGNFGHAIAQLSNGYELYVELVYEGGQWCYHGDIYDDTDGEYELGEEIIDW